jgi:hypothetical protein
MDGRERMSGLLQDTFDGSARVTIWYGTHNRRRFGEGFRRWDLVALVIVGTDRTAMLGPDFSETTWRDDLDPTRTVARTQSRDDRHTWEVPLAPFLGCLGVAPALSEARSTIVPGPFGGNMDCPELRVGNTVFLGARRGRTALRRTPAGNDWVC